MIERREDENAGRARRIRERHRRRTMRDRYTLVVVVAVLAVAAVFLALKLLTAGGGTGKQSLNNTSNEGTSNPSAGEGDSGAVTGQVSVNQGDQPVQDAQTGTAASGTENDPAVTSAIEEAKRLAASYDYDKAAAMLDTIKTTDKSGEAEKLLAQISEEKATLVDADITAVPHIFFHSLIVDTKLAFHNDKTRAEDYNRVMTTVDEFNRMMQQMYDRGYVLVSLHQMAQYTETADGKGSMTAGKISLPPGKKPFVLSIDDMSYYAYMMPDGFATKLIIGADGLLTNEMEKNDGTKVYGSYDVVPLLDDFVRLHPDFSYQGAKGAIALTGYDGVFGYRTDQDYYLKEHLLSNQEEWLDKHPDFDYEKDIAEAKKVAQALRDDGWELATHSWGHRDMKENSMEKFVVDMEKWIDRVESIIGDTDIVIYPFGTDVGSVAKYTMDNEKYAWLHKHGFHYFCNVDSNQPWVQLGDNYLRQGRIDADGYMMYYHPGKLSQFFDVSSVFDDARPTPVPEY